MLSTANVISQINSTSDVSKNKWFCTLGFSFIVYTIYFRYFVTDWIECNIETFFYKNKFADNHHISIKCKESLEWLPIVILLQAYLLVRTLWMSLFWHLTTMDISNGRFLHLRLGACNMFISHPLDTVKTNMQNENMRFVQAARILFKTEGVNVYDIIVELLKFC